MKKKTISGFSKLSKMGKIRWIVENFFKDPENVTRELMSFWHDDDEQQRVLDGFSENTISNYYLPYGVAPNFLVNGKTYAVPMVIEESSVVAAASSAAKFWMKWGGFRAKVISTIKLGQVHFSWKGDFRKLLDKFPLLEKKTARGCGSPYYKYGKKRRRHTRYPPVGYDPPRGALLSTQSQL